MDTRTKKPIVAKSSVLPAVRPLTAFHHGRGLPTDFGHARFYWPGGDGVRESIASRIVKKRCPITSDDGLDTAARVDVLLPADAPQDYVDPDFIVRHYEQSLPADEAVAFVQVTMRFGDKPNLHYPYRIATDWVRNHFVDPLGCPVLMVLHAPHLAGSDADGHAHAIVLPRRASKLGWMGVVRHLGGDAAAAAARASWKAWWEQRMSSQST